MAHVGAYTAALCLLGVVCAAAEPGEDEMMPGIRTNVVASSIPYRRRMPARVWRRGPGVAMPANLAFLSKGWQDEDSHRLNSVPSTESWGISGALLRNDDVSRTEVAPVVFPGDVAGREDVVNESYDGEAAPMMSMDFEEMSMNEQLQISAVNTIDDLVRMLNVSLPPSRGGVVAASTSGASSIAARFGGSSDDGLAVPTLANCSLENQTVRLKIEPQLNVIFFPTCVRLPRCGGCCTGPLLKCRPTDVRPVQLKILKLEQNKEEPQGRSAVASTSNVTSRRRRPKPEGSRRRRETTSSYVIVEEEEHLSCSCQCRVQEQDCNPKTHDYLANECRCACKNLDEQEKCESRSDTHYWHKEDCMCYCYHEDTCSTGQLFDHNSCSCTNADFRSRSGVSFRRGAIASSPVAFPGQ